MKLNPDWGRAIVPEAKLTKYLLSPSHPDGKAKARFFIKHGYTPETLEQGLISAAQTGTVVEEDPNPYGTKFAVVSKLSTPAGTTITIRSVWMVEPGDPAPRLVTAYPEKRR